MQIEYMTKQGLDRLKAKKVDLERRLNEAGQTAGEAAGVNSDWHDNPAYDQAVEEMHILTSQLVEVTELINNARLIEETSSSSRQDVVEIGSRVTVEIDGDEETYFIGGAVDSNPGAGTISYKSPLAQAILGCKVGDVREVGKPSYYGLRVLKIEKPQ